MYVFGTVAKNIKSFNFIRETALILNQSFIQERIIDFIQDRLFDEGKTADGTELKTDNAFGSAKYGSFTMKEKSRKGQKINNVTLKDSGEFYKSFKVQAQKAFISITADFEKDNGNIQENFTLQYNSKKSFSDAILNLTDKEKSIIAEKILLELLIAKFLKTSLNF